MVLAGMMAQVQEISSPAFVCETESQATTPTDQGNCGSCISGLKLTEITINIEKLSAIR